MPNTLKQVVDRVKAAKTAIGSAITTKGGTVGANDGLEDFASDIASIPSGGGGGSQPRKDVNFYDYDGTIVNSYTAAEFAELSELPANPTHEGLTAQGWNWSLADAKVYVADYGSLIIGQMYITSDGKTRLYISLSEGRTSPVLQLYLNANSELDIDWGDGTTHSTFTSTTADYKSERHEYSASGDYVIAITAVSGGFALQASSTNISSILWNGNNSSSSPDRAYNNAIKKIEIGDDVRSIDTYAFSGCYSLSSVTIPDGVTSIGDYAFYNCHALSSITIPDTVTSISDRAFYYCYLLSSIAIPDTVTSIGSNTLYNCHALSSITIPDTVTSIGAGDFSGCPLLSSIIIPDSVTSIGEGAFSGCSSLSSIIIPDSVTSIGSSAFQNCYSLSSIIIPDSVTSIGSSAFQNCYSLSSITILDSVTSIGSRAFSGCSYMSYIKFESTTPPTVANSNAWSNVSTSTKIFVPVASYNTYITGTNYPNPSTFTYLTFGTYTSGATLPDVTPDSEYSLVWYASMADATSQTNPITVGNGNEVYARATAIISVSRYVDFPNNTTTITGSPSSLTAYTGINRCNVSDDGTINAYYGDAGYTEDGSNGQVMVKIPKFYYKVIPDTDGGLDNDNIRKCTWKISDSSLGGYTLHPAFYDEAGNEIDYFLYGAFDGVGQNSEGTYGTEYNTSSDKLASVAGSAYLPLNTLTRATARTMATNRGAGWYQAAIKQTAAVQMLLAVEYGFNAQKAIGNGVVSASAATYAGQTTGNVTSGTTANKTTPVSWRGIENFWGNIWIWIDGINTVDRVPFLCAGYNFADASAAGDTQIAFALPTEGYVTAFGYDSNNDWILLPSETSSTAAPAGPIGDYLYSSAGQCVAQFGGRWQRDQYAGAFFWCCNNPASKTGNDIGARLMFIPTGAV